MASGREMGAVILIANLGVNQVAIGQVDFKIKGPRHSPGNRTQRTNKTLHHPRMTRRW
jgi:hypothetical protein